MSYPPQPYPEKASEPIPAHPGHPQVALGQPQVGTNSYMVNHQPQAIPTMQIGGNRNAKNLPFENDGRKWSHGLFDCLGDCGTCLFSCFCPCIVYGQNKQRLDYLNSTGVPDPERGGSGVNIDCLVHYLLLNVGASWILQMLPRASIRNRYRIRGDTLGDCCAAFWCTPCELTQESREIELEENSFTIAAQDTQHMA